MAIMHGLCLFAPATFSWGAFAAFGVLYFITGQCLGKRFLVTRVCTSLELPDNPALEIDVFEQRRGEKKGQCHPSVDDLCRMSPLLWVESTLWIQLVSRS